MAHETNLAYHLFLLIKFYWNTVTPMDYLWLLSNHKGRVE